MMEQRALFNPQLLKPCRKPERLEELRREALQCEMCKLSQTRTNVVFGEGPANARLVLVGEAPGADEDASGRPFVGRAGQLLSTLLDKAGIERTEVFVCNTVLCRPPKNRRPDPVELIQCDRFLIGQLQAIQPAAIVALGSTAAYALLKTKKQLGELRGKWFAWRDIPVRVTFHPAYLLRNPAERQNALLDMEAVKTKVGDLMVAREEENSDE